MDVLECIRTRRSVRKYEARAVAMDLVGQVLEAGRMAPTAGNLQNFKMILVRDKARRQAIAEACMQQYWMGTAPVHIVIVADPQRARQFYYERGEKLYSVQNCALIAMNMQLAAWSQGLGSCFVGAFDDDKLRDACGIPDYISPQGVLTVGYPAEKPEIPTRYKLWDMAYIERWEARIANLGWVTREISPTIEKKVKETREEVKKKAEKILELIRDKTVDVHNKIEKKMRERRESKKK